MTDRPINTTAQGAGKPAGCDPCDYPECGCCSAPAARTQEPVAWRWKVYGQYQYAGGFPVSGAEPLYTTPQAAPNEIARLQAEVEKWQSENARNAAHVVDLQAECDRYHERLRSELTEGDRLGRYVHIDNVVYHLDDIEVDKDGKCAWTDVANALAHIKLCIERFNPPSHPSTERVKP